MWRRRLAWSLAWGMAAVGVAVVVAAWRCRREVTVVGLRAAHFSGFVAVTPQHVAGAVRATADSDLLDWLFIWKRVFGHGPTRAMICVESRRSERADTETRFGPAVRHGQLGEFRYASGHPKFGPSFRLASAPTWFAVAVLLAPLVLLAARRLRFGRRVAVGVCASCGYDLRMTPDRCPECGAVPA